MIHRPSRLSFTSIQVGSDDATRIIRTSARELARLLEIGHVQLSKVRVDCHAKGIHDGPAHVQEPFWSKTPHGVKTKKRNVAGNSAMHRMKWYVSGSVSVSAHVMQQYGWCMNDP